MTRPCILTETWLRWWYTVGWAVSSESVCIIVSWRKDWVFFTHEWNRHLSMCRFAVYPVFVGNVFFLWDLCQPLNKNLPNIYPGHVVLSSLFTLYQFEGKSTLMKWVFVKACVLWIWFSSGKWGKIFVSRHEFVCVGKSGKLVHICSPVLLRTMCIFSFSV